MENKINCSRHLVVTGKVITCAAFSSAATYPCRIPRRSQLFFRLYFRLTPVIEKGWTSRVPDKSSSDGEEPFDEEGGKKNRGEKLWSWFHWEQDSVCNNVSFLGLEGACLQRYAVSMGLKDGGRIAKPGKNQPSLVVRELCIVYYFQFFILTSFLFLSSFFFLKSDRKWFLNNSDMNEASMDRRNYYLLFYQRKKSLIKIY